MPNEPRAILNGILWIPCTGAPWRDLPERYPPPCQTCHVWFQRWRKEGVFDAVLLALADNLRERGSLDLREAFIHGRDIRPGKKRGRAVGRPKRGKGARLEEDWGIEIIAPNRKSAPKHKMAAPCGVIAAVGKSSGCSPSCKTSAALSQHMSFMRKTFWRWHNWAAL